MRIHGTKVSFIGLGMVLVLILVVAGSLTAFSSGQKKQQVTLTAILDNLGDQQKFSFLINSALQKLNQRHHDMQIQVDQKQFVYPNERTQFLRAMANQTPVDLMSLDQIWLGELAQKGLLTDLTHRTQSWGRASDWYETNFDGGVYKGKVYGIWVWTDVRGMYYWKDLLNRAGVDPNSLMTWDGYLASAQKLEQHGLPSMHLTGASHSPDIWYPYLWMLGGDILKQKQGHSTKGTYWFPIYNSTEGVRALGFLKEQLNAGIKPQK
jgi:multiple sugar transport system substrate-binding protein